MSQSLPVRAVIWDFGGVLVRTEDRSHRAAWERKLGLAEGDLDEIVFNGRMGRQATLGTATAQEVWSWVGEQLKLEQASLIDLRKAFWGGDRLDEALMDFIRELRPTWLTGLLSNAWPDLRKAIEQRWQIADAFDQVVISAEVLLAKPDPRIYQLILQRLGVLPEASVFVDDFEENVNAASEIGMRGVHFEDPAQAMREVRSLLSA